MTAILMNIMGILHLVEPLVQSALTTWIGFRRNQDLWACIYVVYFTSFGIVSIRSKKAEKLRRESEVIFDNCAGRDERVNLLDK